MINITDKKIHIFTTGEQQPDTLSQFHRIREECSLWQKTKISSPKVCVIRTNSTIQRSNIRSFLVFPTFSWINYVHLCLRCWHQSEHHRASPSSSRPPSPDSPLVFSEIHPCLFCETLFVQMIFSFKKLEKKKKGRCNQAANPPFSGPGERCRWLRLLRSGHWLCWPGQKRVRTRSENKATTQHVKMLVGNKTKITFEESPFCTADPEKTDEEEPPFCKKKSLAY